MLTNEIITVDDKETIEAVWQACVEFITEYNATKH